MVRKYIADPFYQSNYNVMMTSRCKKHNVITIVIILFVFLIMVKTLTTVGNSKAVILPKRLIDKYHLHKVIIQETEEGILILPATGKPTFQEKLEILRKNRKEVYTRMKAQADNPETISFYEKNDLSEVDVDIVEE
ncbi:MAG: AbrB/MazE/SpoVT family DNA-binding domain-containing protein [Cyclobacteriaceae bacterium]|nr:AbrB/MazE/SpoVT family DNA-binding domain-containing protein [Cyclobacteriaceae bacterium]